MKPGYNGWENYETWNVILWVNNDEGLYNLARTCSDYQEFCMELREAGNEPISRETPDKVAWNDSGINLDEVNEAISEIRDGDAGE